MANTIQINVRAQDQASAALRNTATAIDEMEASAASSGGSLRGLRNELGAFLGGAGIAAGLLASAAAIVNQGEAIADAAIRFDAYTERIDANGDALERLREVSRGAATDTQLMANAAQALQVGAATTEEELLKLIEIGSVIGGGAAGVEALVGALKNGVSSIELLDDVGLSAGNVRARMEELKEAGYDAQEAFRMAVLAEGQAQLDRFGGALAAQASNIDRLAVDIQNVVDRVALGAQSVVNDALGSLYALIEANNRGVLPELLYNAVIGDEAERVRTEAISEVEAFARDYGEAFFQALNSMGGSDLDTEWLTNIASGTIDALRNDPALQADVAGLYSELAANLNMPLDYIVSNAAVVDAAASAYLGTLVEQYNTMQLLSAEYVTLSDAQAEQYADLRGQHETAVALAAQERHRADVERTIAGYQAEQARLMADTAAAYADIAQNAANHDAVLYGAVEAAQQMSMAYSDMTLYAGEIDGVTLFTEEAAATLAGMRAEYESMVEQAQVLNEQGVISDSELAYIQSAADEVGRMANEAERGAQAFASMSLSDILGQGDGGALGDFSSILLDAARGQGMSEGQLAAFERNLALESGQETAASVALTDEVAPRIGEIVNQYGAEVGAEVARQVTEQLANATLEGATAEQIAGVITDVLGMSNAELASGALGGLDLFNPEQAQVATQISTSLAAARTEVHAMQTKLVELTNEVHTIPVRVEISNRDDLERMVGGLLVGLVRGNGGATPGTTPRSSPQ